MTKEFDLPRGRQDGRVADVPASPVSPEAHKARFDELAGAFTRGELARQNEDGSTTTVVSYEKYIDPLNRQDLTLLSEFRLRAAAAGLREAFSPLILPTQAVISSSETEAVRFQGSDRPLTVVQLGYEKPGQPSPQRRR
jgi:hypothetical protein